MPHLAAAGWGVSISAKICAATTVYLIPVVISALLTTRILAGSAAVRATNGFVLKALFLVERLFAFGECEFSSAILANDHLVRHGAYLLINIG